MSIAQCRPAPGGDLDSYHVRAIYAALDVSGVRGDGDEDSEELTRARVKTNHRGDDDVVSHADR